MKRLSRLAATTIYGLALAGILILGGSKYDWMADVDPAFNSSVIETNGNRQLTATLLLVMALSATAILVATNDQKGVRLIPLLLAVLAIALYLAGRA